MNYIAFDSHKKYILASVEDRNGNLLQEERIGHPPGALREFLLEYEKGFLVAWKL